MSASSSDPTPGKDGGPAGSGAAAPVPAGKKTNVCLICGIYTNLSLNIFEPRNGPNIREVIYQKYNFKAERGDNEDKYICFSCNNWLINWYSLQHLSESRSYESTQASSSRQSQSQSSENRNKRPKNNGRSNNSSSAPGSSRDDKENLEQDNVVSSTVKTPEKNENASPKRKPKRTTTSGGRPVLKQQNLITSSSSSNSSLVKPFESRLIRMLENQGTTVIKENATSGGPFVPRYPFEPPSSSGKRTPAPLAESPVNGASSEIILSFNSISEVVNVMPSTSGSSPDSKLISHQEIGENFLRTHRLSRSLSISLIDSSQTTPSTEH